MSQDHSHNNGATHDSVDERVKNREDWAFRRRRGIPNNRKLFVLTCMDERVNVEEALGLKLGDAHIFRNAGGIVTDDVIRSAALSTNIFGTTEIIVVTHSDCGMLLLSGDQLAEALDEALKSRGSSLADAPVDPALPGLQLPGSHGD
ncbi:MAG: carbonic anhydrase, partial [Planctomycetota bacterium]